MDPLIIVSCDGHVGALAEEYREYLDPQYRPLVAELLDDERKYVQMHDMLVSNLYEPERLALVDERKAIQSGGLKSGWDMDLRVRELDAEGIAAEVLYPGTINSMTPFFYSLNRPYPDDIRMAGTRAYHRWLADKIAPSKGRLIGTADPGPSVDMDATLEELRFVAERGFRAVFVPGHVLNPALPPIFDRHFEPFWAACSDLGLVPTIHAGWNTKQGEITKILDATGTLLHKREEMGEDSAGIEGEFMKVIAMMNEDNPESVFSLDLAPRRAIWQMIFGGVFDRYPNLKLVVAECRADWVPTLKAFLDQHFLTKRPNIKMKPSEYFGRNVFISPSSPRRAEAELRRDIGVGNFLFGSDFPHVEGTWPNTLTWLRTVFHDVTENELRAILGENAITVYGLDKNWLKGIAAKIGFAPSDVIGDYKTDDRVIADFEFRSNFSKSSPVFDPALMDSRVNDDLAAMAS